MRYEIRGRVIDEFTGDGIGGVRVTFRPHRSFTDAVRDRAGPFIVIANHFGAFDGLVMAEALLIEYRDLFERHGRTNG